MPNTFRRIAFVSITFMCASIAAAQDTGGQGILDCFPEEHILPPDCGWPRFPYRPIYEEALLYGWAERDRARGMRNYYDSMAAINREEARSLEIANKAIEAETRFELRRINREVREKERGPRPTAADLERFARDRMPDRLKAGEFDATLGKLSWPAVLESPHFAAEKIAIDRLFEERTIDDSGLGSDNHRAIKQVVEQTKSKLKSQIDRLGPSEYVAAKNFLTRLEYEAQHVVAPDGLVAK